MPTVWSLEVCCVLHAGGGRLNKTDLCLLHPVWRLCTRSSKPIEKGDACQPTVGVGKAIDQVELDCSLFLFDNNSVPLHNSY